MPSLMCSAKDEAFFAQDSFADYVPASWLNLLFYLPLSQALQGQPKAIWRYSIRRDIDGGLITDEPQLDEETRKDIFAQKWSFWFIGIGTIIWGFGDLINNFYHVGNTSPH